MRTALLLAALVVVAFAIPSEEEIKGQFADFIVKYNKVYATSEINTRYENFRASLVRAEKMQAEVPTAKFGITKFSDMTPEEFKATMLMKTPVTEDASPLAPVTSLIAPGAPASFDWRDKGGVTPVKDQGQCGSCWAFSATEATESAWILKGKATPSTINLSPQQIVDCDTTDAGCNGGRTESAYEYLISAGGEEGVSNYPYTAKDGTCKFKKGDVVASISAYTSIPKDETALSAALSTTGPLSICLAASRWQDYQSGVMSNIACCPLLACQMDHCVQLVGYNSTASTPYWMVRNSWNTDWGVEGYIWLEMGKDTCGLANDVTWPTV